MIGGVHDGRPLVQVKDHALIRAVKALVSDDGNALYINPNEVTEALVADVLAEKMSAGQTDVTDGITMTMVPHSAVTTVLYRAQFPRTFKAAGAIALVLDLLPVATVGSALNVDVSVATAWQDAGVARPAVSSFTKVADTAVPLASGSGGKLQRVHVGTLAARDSADQGPAQVLWLAVSRSGTELTDTYTTDKAEGNGDEETWNVAFSALRALYSPSYTIGTEETMP